MLRSPLCIVLSILFFNSILIAQATADSNNTSQLPHVALDPSTLIASSYNPPAIGTVSGRIFNDADPVGTTEEAAPKGISGIKITIRSTDPAYKHFLREEFSAEDGSFEFGALSPGKYTLQIDPATLPANYRLPESLESTIEVEEYKDSRFQLAIAPHRSITGIVFIDRDGDGRYRKEKDEAVAGATIAVDGHILETDAEGSYSFRDLPPGRVAILIRHPKKEESTHLVLFLSAGPVNNRVVNIPISR